MGLLALIFVFGLTLFASATVTPETSGTGDVLSPYRAGRPALAVTSLRPFTVVGSGFRAGETVRVTVRAETGAAAARDRAGAAGRIDARFRGVKLGRCPQYVVSASGDKGSTARLRSIPRACGIDPRSPP